MPKYLANNRFLVLFFLLSFMLLSIAITPAIAGINSSVSVNAPQQDGSGSSSYLSLSGFNCSDYLNAENISFIIGCSQSFQTRRLLEESSENLSSLLPCTFSSFSFAALSFQELVRLFCSNKITEFIHAKDGMI